MGCYQSSGVKDDELPTVDECISSLFKSVRRKNFHAAVFLNSDDAKDKFIQLITQRLKPAGFATEEFKNSSCKFTTGAVININVAYAAMECDQRDFQNPWVHSEVGKRGDYEQIKMLLLQHAALHDGIHVFQMVDLIG